MPKRVEDGDTRLDLDHIAVNMYGERVKEDAKKSIAEIYGRNPDARRLYFKGVQDTIILLETWGNMGVSKELMSRFLGKLAAQTKDEAAH
jgi:hypothetical protein